jgi:undecaprenyl diphosphate synthase
MILPRHVAIIMDGNGRWAASRGRPRSDGHREGATALRRTVSRCLEVGVRYLTVFAFSTENWARPRSEVTTLMGLLSTATRNELDRLVRNRVELKVIGDRTRLPRRLQRELEAVERITAGACGLRLSLALSYGGRAEIAAAAQSIARSVERGELETADIDEVTVAAHLQTGDTPPPDLVIRTGGEQRLSNFLLWQAAYAELVFEPAAWPDFDAAALDRALAEYGRRQRRFGGIELAVAASAADHGDGST